jgi:hypothetical protein
MTAACRNHRWSWKAGSRARPRAGPVRRRELDGLPLGERFRYRITGLLSVPAATLVHGDLA